MCVYVCMYVCVCCVYIYIYIYIYIKHIGQSNTKDAHKPGLHLEETSWLNSLKMRRHNSEWMLDSGAPIHTTY